MQSFLAYLEITYTLIWLGTTLWCLELRTNDSVAAGVFLSLIYGGFWREEMFNSPGDTLSFHFLLLIALLLSSKSVFWRVFFGVLSLMAVADSIWLFMPGLKPYLVQYIPEMKYLFPYDVFWWQSLLIVLFMFLCGLTLIMNYYTHRLDRANRELEHGDFGAYLYGLFEFAKGHIYSRSQGDSGHKRIR